MAVPAVALPSEVDDASSNPFGLYPAPAIFIDLLKLADRSDLASELFVKMLDSYLTLRRQNCDPLRSVANALVIVIYLFRQFVTFTSNTLVDAERAL